MLRKKDSRKIHICLIGLFVIFLFSGCGEKMQEELQSSEEITVMTNSGEQSVEDQDNLSVSVINEKEAEFLFSSDSIFKAHSAGKDAKESNIVYSWKTLFGPFCVVAMIYYQEGVKDYTLEDIQCSLTYLERYEDGGYSTWEIKRLDYQVEDDGLKVTVILPTEEELALLQDIDTSQLASYEFDQVEKYEYSENEQGSEIIYLTYEPEDIKKDYPDQEQSKDSQESIFPEAVYAAGFQKGDNDAAWMVPSTGNYQIYDKSKIDSDGITGLEQNILLVFDEAGNLTDGYVRELQTTGTESSENGFVPTFHDPESLEQIFQDKLAEGFLRETSGEILNQGEAGIAGHYIYYRLLDSTVEQVHGDSAFENCINDYEWITKSPWKAISRMPEVSYTTEEIQLIYESDMVFDSTAPLFENYCALDDFKYVGYIEMVTDDYYISETINECNVYFFDETGKCINYCRVIDISDSATYKSALAGGYEKIEGSETLVINNWDENLTETKEKIILNYRSIVASGEYSSYEQSISQNGLAIYCSKPWLNQ